MPQEDDGGDDGAMWRCKWRLNWMTLACLLWKPSARHERMIHLSEKQSTSFFYKSHSHSLLIDCEHERRLLRAVRWVSNLT